jgi:hypothetical protein
MVRMMGYSNFSVLKLYLLCTALGFVVGLHTVYAERNEQQVHNDRLHLQQQHRILPDGWQQKETSQQGEKHPIIQGSNAEEKKKDFLFSLEKQMGADVVTGSKSKSKSSKTVHRNYKPKTLQQELEYDRGNKKYDPKYHHPQSMEQIEFEKHSNGIYYDPTTGKYIDTKIISPIDNATTASINTTISSTGSNMTTTTITTTTIVTTTGDGENDGLYYDPVTGSFISNSTGHVIPDSFYYYARKGNSGSKKSKKSHKKSCKKKKKGKGKSKGKGGKKSNKKWYDECAYRKPNIHPDKAYPKECIYDYANHVRYCKSKYFFFVIRRKVSFSLKAGFVFNFDVFASRF